MWLDSIPIGIDKEWIAEQIAKLEINVPNKYDLEYEWSFNPYYRLLNENQEKESQKLIIDGFIMGLDFGDSISIPTWCD